MDFLKIKPDKMSELLILMKDLGFINANALGYSIILKDVTGIVNDYLWNTFNTAKEIALSNEDYFMEE